MPPPECSHTSVCIEVLDILDSPSHFAQPLIQQQNRKYTAVKEVRSAITACAGPRAPVQQDLSSHIPTDPMDVPSATREVRRFMDYVGGHLKARHGQALARVASGQEAPAPHPNVWPVLSPAMVGARGRRHRDA